MNKRDRFALKRIGLHRGIANTQFARRDRVVKGKKVGVPRQGEANYAQAPNIAMDPGEDLFRRRRRVCHAVGRICRAWQPSGIRRGRTWLARWPKAPDQMLAEMDAIATALRAQCRGLRCPI